MFACDISLESLYIPASMEKIGNGAFMYCRSLESVHYNGTREQWKNIEIGPHNDDLLCAKICCRDGEV
jgi:hypothetical protein